MSTPTDVYDKEVERLSERVSASGEYYVIYDAWKSLSGVTASVLFGYASPDRTSRPGPGGIECGCLTQIRFQPGIFKALDKNGEVDEALTQQIANDERIPRTSLAISLENLPIFAEWQRRLDQCLERTPPV